LQESFGVRGDRVGEVTWHSLEKDGTITHYDIRFGRKTVSNVPADLVEAKKVQEHKHETRERR